MVSQRGPATGKGSTGTLSGDKGNAVLSQEASRLFKTQDLGYVRTMRNKTAKEVLALEMRVTGIEGEGRKIVYVDNRDEQLERMEVDQEVEEEEDMKMEENLEARREARRLQRLKDREMEKLEIMLEAAKKRLETLIEVETALDLQRAKMNKTQSVGGVNKAGIKFKVRERKT
jgi:U3 small nucleolar RNA-associated protein 11